MSCQKVIVHAGRKHQLRIHCANALSAPIVGDTRYGSTRNEVHRSLLQHLKTFQQTEHEESEPQTLKLDSQANSPPKASSLLLLLHAHTICIQKPEEAAVGAIAKPAGQMDMLLKVLSWAPHLVGTV